MKVMAVLLKAAFKEFLRDRTSLSFVVLMPLLFVVFFGLAYQGLAAQTVWQTTTVSGLEFLVPGVLGLAVMWLGLFAAIPLAADRELGVLRRFATVPVSLWSFVAAQVGVRLVVSLAQAALVLAAGWLLFGVVVHGSWLLLYLVVALGGLAFVALGYAIAALSSTQQAAHGWAQLASFPMLFLSGVFFPVETLPSVLWPLAQALPLTHLVEALRYVALVGTDVNSLIWDAVVLTAWAALGLAVSVRYFRWA